MKWCYECKKCNKKLHPENMETGPNPEEEKWIREHYPHGIDMVVNEPPVPKGGK